ncbi:MAG: glutathione S-transferase family protein [Caulobacterales bacterium]|jgi:glutathione S-transferase
MLRVWGRLNSSNVQKVMWTLDELGLAYEHIPAGGDFGIRGTPEFLAMNPHNWVPVIDDDGTIVWESQAIVRYLAAAHGAGTLWDTDPGRRAYADMWMDWNATTLQRDFGALFWAWFRTPPAQRDQARIAELQAASDADFGKLDVALAKRPFLAGDHLTMGDIPAGCMAYRYFNLDLDRPALPHAQAWFDRLMARPAYRKFVAIPFEDLRGRLAF